jgi:hypothetical protein
MKIDGRIPYRYLGTSTTPGTSYFILPFEFRAWFVRYSFRFVRPFRPSMARPRSHLAFSCRGVSQPPARCFSWMALFNIIYDAKSCHNVPLPQRCFVSVVGTEYCELLYTVLFDVLLLHQVGDSARKLFVWMSISIKEYIWAQTGLFLFVGRFKTLKSGLLNFARF